MSCQKSRFWLENLPSLISSMQLVPIKDMDFREQLNSLTRVILIVFVILYLLKFEYSIHFLIISIAFVIIIFYIKKRKEERNDQMQKSKIRENYAPRASYTTASPTPNVKNTANLKATNLGKLTSTNIIEAKGQKIRQTLIDMPIALPFCNDFVSVNDVDFASGNLTEASNFAAGINQSLVGKANPKTFIAPVVKPPIYDLEYWRDNNLITFSQINRADSQQDMYLSGYAESTCCDYLGPNAEIVPKSGKKVKIAVGGEIPPFTEDYRGEYPADYRRETKEHYAPDFPSVGKPCGRNPIQSPFPGQDQQYVSTMRVPKIRAGYAEEYIEPYAPRFPTVGKPCGYNPIQSPFPEQDQQYVSTTRVPRVKNGRIQPGEFVENFGDNEILQDSYTKVSTEPEETYYLQSAEPGWVNQECGYDPKQLLEANLPSNLPAGNCEKDPRMATYNKNLFTQIVTPGVYTRNQIIEPIGSNIGISFQQQFEPVTCSRDEKGLHYLEHDPRIIQKGSIDFKETYGNTPNYDNVYDPRFYGYGTSYRSYNDPVTGQTRFMYDDVNAIRMPNYIVRSKIDHLPYADTYGPVEEGSEFGNVHNPNMRQLVQDSWLRNSLEFRNDLMERRMRKINSEMWQKRQFPIGARPVGS